MTSAGADLDRFDVQAILNDLVTVGSDVVMGYRGQLLETSEKAAHGGLVTSADLASEKAMLALLAERRPTDGVISEERGLVPGSGDLTWVLDPLDGTANFARGSENFGVIAGLLQGDTPVAGAMMLPAVGVHYVAYRGAGFTRNGHSPERPPTPALRDAIVDHSLLHLAEEEARRRQHDTLDAVLAAARGVRCDHSVRYIADTIDGILDGFVYHTLGLWDIVGTSVILGEAGVLVSDLDGAPLDLSPSSWKPGRLYPTVGAAPGLHGELIQALATT